MIFIQQWRCACSVGKDFRPSPTNLINTKGKLVSKPVRAETFADYLADQVWKAPSPEISLTLLPWNRCHKQPTHLPEKNLTSSSARFVSAVALGRLKYRRIYCSVSTFWITITTVSNVAKLPPVGFTQKWSCKSRMSNQIPSSFQSLARFLLPTRCIKL